MDNAELASVLAVATSILSNAQTAQPPAAAEDDLKQAQEPSPVPDDGGGDIDFNKGPWTPEVRPWVHSSAGLCAEGKRAASARSAAGGRAAEAPCPEARPQQLEPAGQKHQGPQRQVLPVEVRMGSVAPRSVFRWCQPACAVGPEAQKRHVLEQPSEEPSGHAVARGQHGLGALCWAGTVAKACLNAGQRSQRGAPATYFGTLYSRFVVVPMHLGSLTWQRAT